MVKFSDSPSSATGDEMQSCHDVEVICAYENVVVLLFISPGEKNLEQWEMMIEGNTSWLTRQIKNKMEICTGWLAK